MKTSKINKWRNVKNDLPCRCPQCKQLEGTELFLVYAEHNVLKPMRHLATYWENHWIFKDWDEWKVTHWILLLEPPSVE